MKPIRFMAIIAIASALTVLFSATVSAYNEVTVDIPVTLEALNTSGQSEQNGAKAVFRLTPVDEGAPMPIGSSGGIYEFSASVGEEVVIPFVFRTAGSRKYILSAESDYGEISPDSIELTVIVYEYGGELVTAAYAETSSGQKSGLRFVIKLPESPDYPPVDTGDKSNTLIWILTAVVSLTCAVYAIKKKKRPI